jgi:probable HAF family extracellular repeat protein
MKTIPISIAAGSLLATLLVAQPRYTITNLGSSLPSGWSSQASFVSNSGVLTGVATAPNGTQHAVVWVGGRIVDISTPGLGGPNSGASGFNGRGQVVGVAESSDIDPNHENFCGYGTGLKCFPFLWQGGTITSLPLLGGNNGAAGPINSKGEATGVAENRTPDRDCAPGVAVNGTGPQVLDYRGVIWGPRPGAIQELRPLLGDTVSMALWINDNREAVGISGLCANTIIPPIAVGPHAVLWERDGSPHDLGSLGGTVNTGLLGVGNAALSINNQGWVAGASSLAGNTSNHAFLWTRATGMRDLGTLTGFTSSAAAGVNDRGEVVGTSYDASDDFANLNLTAFLWRNGKMTDLTRLIVGDSPFDLLFFATGINDSGQIVGFGLTSTGDVHAFLATPRRGDEGEERGEPQALRVLRPKAISDNARKLLRGGFPMRW